MYNSNEQQGSSSNAAGFLLGALTGALVGAGVALLFAPKTGKKMREDLMKTYEGASEKISSFATEAINQAGSIVGRATDRASDFVDDAASTAHDAVDQGRNKVNHVMSSVQQQAKARS